MYASPTLKRNASERTRRSFRSYTLELTSLSGLLRLAVIFTISLLMVSGCGRKELEDAKQQINNLTAENKKLTELSASLDNDKNRLNQELKTLSDKNSRMQRELDELNKSRATLSDENKKLKEKNSAIEQEIASLKSEKSHQAQEIEGLKKRVAELAPPQKAPALIPSEIGPQSSKPKELSPCDAVIEFMKTSEQVVRQQRGAERSRSLEQVKKQYNPRMQGAPAKAIKAAENWVKEGAKFWDESPDDAVLRMLELRNTVLDACGKSPDSAGFK
jgi:myosin heavy subunit